MPADGGGAEGEVVAGERQGDARGADAAAAASPAAAQIRSPSEQHSSAAGGGGGDGNSSIPAPSTSLHPPASAFQQRSLQPLSSTSTSGSSPSPASTLSRRLATLAEEAGGTASPTGGGGAARATAASPPHRPPRPPQARPPSPPAARLPSAVLLGGASSISIASPFMQQQISSVLGSEEGGPRWLSGAGFGSGPPSAPGSNGPTPALAAVEEASVEEAAAPVQAPAAAAAAAPAAAAPLAGAAPPLGTVPVLGSSDWGPIASTTPLMPPDKQPFQPALAAEGAAQHAQAGPPAGVLPEAAHAAMLHPHHPHKHQHSPMHRQQRHRPAGSATASPRTSPGSASAESSRGGSKSSSGGSAHAAHAPTGAIPAHPAGPPSTATQPAIPEHPQAPQQLAAQVPPTSAAHPASAGVAGLQQAAAEAGAQPHVPSPYPAPASLPAMWGPIQLPSAPGTPPQPAAAAPTMPAAASPASAAAAARPTVVSPPPMHVALVIPPQQARAPAQAAQLQQPPSPPAVPAQPMPGVIPAVAATLAAADPATQAAILAAIQQQQQQQQDAGLAAMQQQQAEQLAAQQQQQASLLAEQQQRAAAAAAAAEQQQAALLAAQHQAQQRQAQQEAASAAAAEAEQQQAALLAAQQQQDAAAAAAAAQREHNALLAVQQQQAALMAAQQQEQQTAMQAAQQQAAWAAAVADQQQQQALFEAQQQAALAAAAVDHRQQQALLLAQQQAGALLAAQQAAQQAAAAQQQAVAQAAVPPMQASVAPPAYLPVGYLPALPGYAPAPQLQQQLQLTPHVAALMQRQVSQALSGFSGGGSEAGPGQLPFFPSGEPPLRYSPSPQPLRHRSLHPMSAAEAVGMAVSPSAFAAAAAGQRRARVKAVVSSGGRFRPPALAGRASGAAAFLPSAPGSWLYEGGETRLVSLPDGCSLLELLAVLGSKQQRGLATAALLSPRVPSPAAQPPPAGRQPAAGAGRGSASLSAGITYYTPALGSPPGASQAPSTQGSGATAGDQGPAGFATPLQTPASLTGVAESVATSGLEAAAAAVAAAARSSSGLQKLCIVRYRLPSEPDMFVDIVDEEDVRLMFEEYHDWVEEGLPGSGGNTGGRKLHIFVEWAPLQAAGAGVSDASADFDLRPVGPPGALTPSDSSMEVPDQAPPAAPSPPPKLSDLTSTKIEVIPGDDVQLTALLGAGTFGDTYRGNWHESLVAVKCINPLMIGVQYASRQAWIDFLRDANQMGKLRHPSLCEVYGVVLPHDTDPRLAAPRSRSEPTAPATLPASVSAPAPAQQAQQALHTPLGLPGPLPVGLVAPPAGPPTPGSLPASAMPQFAGMLPAASQAEGGPRAGSPPASGAAGLMLQRESTLPVVAGTLPQALPGPVANPPATVMEFVGGKSLHNAIASRSDLVFSRLSRVVYALDTAKALSYLHSRRVAHLDIKSGNILLGWRDRRPSAKVVGYGLTGRKVSMVRCAAQGVTSAASMLPWTAPEVLRTPELVTGKADVFSFAVVMWELWALKQPYEGQDPMELLTRIRQGEVVRPALPGTDEEPPAEEPGPGWRALLERCWAQDPEQRPDFAVVEEELRGIAREVKRQQPPGRPRPAIPLPRSGSRGTALRRAPSGAPPRRQNSGEAAAAATGVLPAAANRHGSGFLLARQAGSGVWAPEQPARVQAAAPASAPPGLPPPEHQRQEPPQQPERAPGQQEQEEHAARAALPQYEAQQEGSPLPETQAGAAAAGPAGHAPPEVAASS